MKHGNLDSDVFNIIQIHSNLLYTLLHDKSTCAIFTAMDKSLNPNNILSTIEIMLKTSKQSKCIQFNLAHQLTSLIHNFLTKISIDERLQAIKFCVKKMSNFIFFLNTKKNSGNDKSKLDTINTLYEKIKEPLENQKFSYEITFLRQFSENFQNLIYETLPFYKSCESLSRQFILYSNNLEIIICELFRISTVSNQLNYVFTILNSYLSSLQAKKETDPNYSPHNLDQGEISVFRKKLPNDPFKFEDL